MPIGLRRFAHAVALTVAAATLAAAEGPVLSVAEDMLKAALSCPDFVSDHPGLSLWPRTNR
jgi:hypothetical protein